MRLALVSPYSLSVPGGVQGQVLALAVELERMGHETVVLGPLDGPVPEGGGTRIVGLGRSIPVPANGSVARVAPGPIVWRRAWRAIAEFQPDVLHLHEPLAPGPTWACLFRPEPKLGTFHRAGSVAAGGALAPAARRLAGRLTVRSAVSEEARATAAGLVGGEYEIVGNGVDLRRFAEAAPRPTSGPTILFVGRHEQRKGLPVLLEAFRRIDPATGAVLWIAGHGPATADLGARFGGLRGVEWLGRVDDVELAARLAGAHVLCAPSLGGESFGIVLLEAMAARCVVVASALPGYAAVVGEHGLLVAPGDDAALVEALTDALADAVSGRGRAEPPALDAAARWAAQWSMPTVAARYLSLYDAALQAGPPRRARPSSDA